VGGAAAAARRGVAVVLQPLGWRWDRGGWAAGAGRGRGAMRLGGRPLGGAEAEWVAGLLAARWPELAGRVEVVEEKAG
jgi:hypothetical protein